MTDQKVGTLVLGASENPERYSNKAITRLKAHGESVVAFAKKKGTVAGVDFTTAWDPNWKVDTVTMYLNPQTQEFYRKDILELKPRRVIFNPGSENPIFVDELNKQGIETEYACTLVLLASGQY